MDLYHIIDRMSVVCTLYAVQAVYAQVIKLSYMKILVGPLSISHLHRRIQIRRLFLCLIRRSNFYISLCRCKNILDYILARARAAASSFFKFSCWVTIMRGKILITSSLNMEARQTIVTISNKTKRIISKDLRCGSIRGCATTPSGRHINVSPVFEL